MAADADRHLLFGLLALQNGLIQQAQLVAAFHAWTLDKARPLADHLVALGHLEQHPALGDRSAGRRCTSRPTATPSEAWPPSASAARRSTNWTRSATRR